MAKKKARSTVRRVRKKKIQGPVLSPEARREIAAVILAALTILLLFAIFNFGGTLVTGLFRGLRLGVGFAAYLLPAIFAGLAVMLFRRDDPPRGHNYLG